MVVEVYRQHLATYYEFAQMVAPHKDPNKLYQCFAHHFCDYRFEYESPDYSIDTGLSIEEMEDYQGPKRMTHGTEKEDYILFYITMAA